MSPAARLLPTLASLALAGLTLTASAPQTPRFLPIEEVRPGMVGTGRTVYAGDAPEEFRAHVIGVLHNVVGPGRSLVLARLEGAPLDTAGVIQGMSGSPVYVDGRLLGAVSYALGSFPREPIAGITPIADMVAAVEAPGARVADRDLTLTWPATADHVFAALARLATRTTGPAPTTPMGAAQVVGPADLARLAPALRPIGAAFVLGGFEASVESGLRRALALSGATASVPGGQGRAERPAGLRPGDAVGMSLLRGDLEMGATGTVTHVDGARVYAFGHAFLNLGSTAFPMTGARVHTVLPSLAQSMKIASLGPVIGTMTQDRTTAVGGTLGQGPPELEIAVTLASDRAPERRFRFFAVQDAQLTPLFAFVALFNTLTEYERQTGALSVHARGSVSFGADGTAVLDDFFSGDGVPATAASALTAALGAAAANDFRAVTADRLELRLEVSERQRTTTIERIWLDTVKPAAGAVHTLQVLLRDFRGDTETLSFPVPMPARAQGPLTLLVSDAPTLQTLEQRDLRPTRPTSWPALLEQINAQPRHNRLYVRLIAPQTGTVVGGDALPALPASVRSVLESESALAVSPIGRTVLGAWERRLDRAVKGSRELTLTVGTGK